MGGGRGKLVDLQPLDVDGAHVVGLVAEPSRLELPHLAGDVVAVAQHDDVGANGERCLGD